MNLRSLSFIVLCHGITAALFSIVFLFESLGIAVPFLSLLAQHPNFMSSIYSKTVCLFASVGIATFAIYEIFFFPNFLKSLSKNDIQIRSKIKKLFVSYHILWSIMIVYVALLDGSAWSAWLSVFVMLGFTIWGGLAQVD